MDGSEKVYDIDGLVDWLPTGQISKSVEAMNEWRSCEQVDNGTPSTSPPFWESDDDSDDEFKPSEMFGEFTWKIQKFSQLSKKELKSEVFEVNGYKWYILIYPQGCDVCNHVSIFLCVAEHTQLLPGWGHFAQFTLVVVNKEVTKYKYSDTLHRFCKKEHDWGWKKFLELSKLQDGFLVDGTLQIKAQVQIIRNKPNRPFRCLDRQYRRDLLGIYLSHVEQVCRKFVEDQKSKLRKLLKDEARWSSFCTFWCGLDPSIRQQMSRERSDVLFKVVVKHFFVEKEVTSALVMDSLYSGLKALQMESKCKGRKENVSEFTANPKPIVYVDGDLFILADDLLSLLEKSPRQCVASKDDKESSSQSKAGCTGQAITKDPIEWELERRLTEFGRKTIEIFVLSHIFSQKIEVAFQESVAARIQEELIREEEEEREAELEQKAKQQAADKGPKKKMNKQKRNRNGKGQRKYEKNDFMTIGISDEALRLSGKPILQSDKMSNCSEGDQESRHNDDDDAISVWLTTEDIEGSPATEDSTISDICMSGESSTTEQGFPSFNETMSSTPVEEVDSFELNVWGGDSVSDNGNWNVTVRKKSQKHKALSGQIKQNAEIYREVAANANDSRREITRSSAFLSGLPEQDIDGPLKNHAPKRSYVDKKELYEAIVKKKKIEHMTRQDGIQGSSEQFSVLEASNVRVQTNHAKSNMVSMVRQNGIQDQTSLGTKISTMRVYSESSSINGNGVISRQGLKDDNVKLRSKSSSKSLDQVTRISSLPPSISQDGMASKVGAATVSVCQPGASEQLPSRSASPSPVLQLLNNVIMPKAHAVNGPSLLPSLNGSVSDFNVQRSRTPPIVLPAESSENDLVTGLTFGSLTPAILLAPSHLTEASFTGSPKFLDSPILDQLALTSQRKGHATGSTSNFPATTISGQTKRAPIDEFPHLDIINYLFDEEPESGQVLTSTYVGVAAFGEPTSDVNLFELPRFTSSPGYQSYSQQFDNNYANGLLDVYGGQQLNYQVNSNGYTD